VPFPSYLTSSLGLIAAPAMLDDPDGASHPIGTGPFIFEEWIPNQRFVAKRNPDYWQAGLPYLDEIEFRPIPEYQSRLNALQTGEVDAIYAYGGDSLSEAEDAGGDLQVQEIDDGAFLENYILFNNDTAPFNDEHARKAVAYAIDFDQINQVIDHGLGQPATGPFSGEDQYPVPDDLPTYDPDRVADELAAYKEDTGEDLKFELTATSSAASLQEAELLQDMWKQLGIDVEIRQIEESQLIVSALQGDFQAIPWQFDGFPDPDQEMIFWHSAAAAPVGEIGSNFGRFRNDQVDSLMTQARATADPDERRDLYAQVAQVIIDETPWAYESRQTAFLAAGPNVGGLGSFPIPDSDAKGVEYVQGIIRVGSLSDDG
jgi:ABC-type transport system substrate-binding protein